MPYCSGLSRNTAAIDPNGDIQLAFHLRCAQRCENLFHVTETSEIFLDRLFIDQELTITRVDAHTSRAGLPATYSLIVLYAH